MPLLVDDEKYNLPKADQDKYNGKFAITVIESRIKSNPEGTRTEAGAFSGILTHYNAMINGKRCKVRYYENSYWDDSIRREVYEPEYFMIDGRAGGFNVDNDAEKAWFLHNHPGWDENPLRKAEPGRRATIDNNVMQQFHIRQLKDKHITKIFQVQKAEDALSAASKKWTLKEMKGICHTLVTTQSSALQLPWQVLSFNDIGEGDAEALRGALIITYKQDPLYFHTTIMDNRQNQISEAVITLSDEANRTLIFDPTSFVWSLNEGKKEATKLCTVGQKDDPKGYLVKEALKNKEMGDKLIKAAENISQPA